MNKTSSGFTIVELLIVVVVIAVLAAITIVSYNGIQQQATNASVTTAVNQVIKLTQGHISTYSSLPHTARSCALESLCYYGSLNSTNATFKTNISKIGSLPGGVPTWDTTYGGVLYDYAVSRTYNGQPSTAVIMYFLKGASQNCGREVANSLTSPMTTSTNPYTSVIGNITFCVAPIVGI